MKTQTTIKKRVDVQGRGLHGGKPVKIEFSPAKKNSGITVKNNGESYRLGPDKVFSTKRGTSIRHGRSVIHTVEHLVSAVRGMGIDNVAVDISGNEAPALDGSAFLFVNALKKAGTQKISAPKKQLLLRNPVVLSGKGCWMAVLPFNGFKVRYFSDFSDHGIPADDCSIKITPQSYEKEISKARTFGFKSELKWLMAAGLIKGASLENAVLIDKGKPVKTKLRYKNELTRHKVLDIIGDFGLINAELNMLVIAVKTGHEMNIKTVNKILSNNSWLKSNN